MNKYNARQHTTKLDQLNVVQLLPRILIQQCMICLVDRSPKVLFYFLLYRKGLRGGEPSYRI